MALLALVSFAMSFVESLPLYFSLADGLFFFFVFFYLVLCFLEFFYKSMRGENIDYALSSILFVTDEIDVTKAFFETKIGTEILTRSGVSPESLKDFISSERIPIMASVLNFENNFVDLVIYTVALYEADKKFQLFLSQNSIDKEKFIDSVKWVADKEEKNRHKERFWSRENLEAIPSIVWLCGF